MLSSASDVRRNAAKALDKVGGADPKAVIPALIEALKDRSKRVRSTAAKVLGKVGVADPKAVIPALVTALKNYKFGCQRKCSNSPPYIRLRRP